MAAFHLFVELDHPNPSIERIEGLLRKGKVLLHVGDDARAGELPLHRACCRNLSLPIVRLLVERFPKAVEVKDRNGYLPLHVAIWHSSIDVVCFLIDCYPSALNEPDGFDTLPMQQAMILHPLGYMLTLIGKSTEPAQQLLSYALRHTSNTLLVQVLLTLCEDVDVMCALKTPDRFGDYPIHLATNDHDIAIVEQIIQLDPDCLSLRDSGGNLPLHYAVQRTRDRGGEALNVTKRMITLYPEALKLINDREDLPIHCVGPLPSSELMELLELLVNSYPESLLQQGGDEMLPIHKFIESNRKSTQIIGFLARKSKVSLMIPDDCLGRMAIHHAIRHKASYEVIRLIMENTQMNLLLEPDKRGCLPIHLAIDHWRRKDAEKVFELLLSKSPASMELGSSNSWRPPPLHYAVSAKRLPLNLIQLLDRHSPSSVGLCDELGKLPLHYALEFPRKPSSETVQFLVRKYPEALRMSDIHGWLPLHTGVMWKRPYHELVMVMDKYPDSLRHLDGTGQSPLDYALWGRGMPVIQLLINRDPDSLVLLNEHQMNPLMKACERDVIKLDVLFDLIRGNPMNVVRPFPQKQKEKA